MLKARTKLIITASRSKIGTLRLIVNSAKPSYELKIKLGQAFYNSRVASKIRTLHRIARSPNPWAELKTVLKAKLGNFATLKQRNLKFKEKIYLLKSKVLELRSNLHVKNALIKKHQKYTIMHKVLTFSDQVTNLGDEAAAEIYVSHDILPLLAANCLAEKYGGKIYCDVVEVPHFDKLSIPKPWPRELISFMHAGLHHYLSKCDGLFTVGPSLAKEISTFGPPVRVIQNFCPKEKPVFSLQLKEKIGLSKDDKLILMLNTLVLDFDVVLDALQLLPSNVHLATLGNIRPLEKKEAIERAVKKLGMQSRVHFFPPVPYEMLRETASSANVGLIYLNLSVPNYINALPNRVFDYIASGVPICTTPIADIMSLVTENQIGVVTKDLSPQSLAQALLTALENEDYYRANIQKAAEVLTWESREPILLDFLGNHRSVTFLGIKDLVSHNRTLRMAKTLANAGVKVKICTMSQSLERPRIHDNIQFFLLDQKI